MTIFTAHRSFDSTEIYTFTGIITKATSNKISIYDYWSTTSIDYSGSFKYLYGYLSSGTIKSGTIYESGEKSYTFSGTFDASTYFSYATSTTQDLLNYLCSGNDTFNGSEENDFISFPSYGNDIFNGKGGNDCVVTNYGYNNTVNAGAGNDYIISYGASDVITGGTGSDIFEIHNFATLKDYKLSEGDKIILAADFTSYFTDDMFSLEDWYGSNWAGMFEIYSSQIAVGKGYTSAKDYDDLFAYDTATGKLYMDLDGFGGYASTWIATFSNKPKFTASQLANDVLIIQDTSVTLVGQPALDFLASNTFGTY